MAAPRPTLRVDREARLFAPGARAPASERVRTAVLFGGFLLAHIGLIATLLVALDRIAPEIDPVQEIPVELVPPPPPEPPKQEPPAPPEPEPQKQAMDLEPATDAPREAKKDAPEQQTAREDTSQAPDTAPRPEATPESTAQNGPAEAASEKPADPRPDAETIERAELRQQLQPQPARSEPKPPVPPQPSLYMQQIAALQPIPDYRLAAAAPPTPVGGGDAKNGYLNVLYGKIMPHMHPPKTARPKSQGAVVIYIDTAGHILHQGVVSPSGSPDLDAAAMEAVRRAAPFPAPPKGLPPVRFTYAAP